MDDEKPGPSNASKDDTSTPPALSSVLQEEFNKGAHLITPLSWCPHLEVNFSSTTIRKKMQFVKCKNSLFAFSKMANKNQFLHQKKVRKLHFW